MILIFFPIVQNLIQQQGKIILTETSCKKKYTYQFWNIFNFQRNLNQPQMISETGLFSIFIIWVSKIHQYLKKAALSFHVYIQKFTFGTLLNIISITNSMFSIKPFPATTIYISPNYQIISQHFQNQERQIFKGKASSNYEIKKAEIIFDIWDEVLATQ